MDIKVKSKNPNSFVVIFWMCDGSKFRVIGGLFGIIDIDALEAGGGPFGIIYIGHLPRLPRFVVCEVSYLQCDKNFILNKGGLQVVEGLYNCRQGGI